MIMQDMERKYLFSSEIYYLSIAVKVKPLSREFNEIEFVHLHLHTEFSLLDGAARIRDLVSKACELKMPALAITDHGVMYGVIDFYKEARKAGLKPLIGCEVYAAPRSRFQKEPKKDDYQYHMVLLARNMEGYRNLMSIVSGAFLEGFYYKPRVDRELLERHASGLIALSGCLAGEIPTLLLQGELEKARQAACFYRELFGRENFYLELQDHHLREQIQVNRQLVELSRREEIPLVATNDTHYLRREDAEIHDLLLCVQTGKNVHEEGRLKFESPEFYFKSPLEMHELFKELPEAIKATLEIAERCQVDFDFSTVYLPEYSLPEGTTADAQLKQVCLQGLQERYQAPGEDLRQRLEYELSVIGMMDYASYFLIVWDLVRYARHNRILVGPGRGSAAGSLVAYCLGITSIDPIRHGLLFERFLNPERISLPDIDIDFCDDRRDQVLSYVVEKYGEDKVAQIITFGTMAARAALRDVGRALGIPYGEVDRIAKLIPFEVGMTINKALELNQELRTAYQDGRYRQLIDASIAVEGLPRHASVHAAGVVISRAPLVNLVPLQKTTEGVVLTQFPMGTLETLGLLKMDFLGLKTLTIIGEAAEHIRRRHKVDLDFDRISLEDEKSYRLLSGGDTAGIFQLESSGMRGVLRELQPNKFEDIIAVVALYRPGPMEQIPTFINSKHGREPISYQHPVLEPILKETYGVIVYQEQIMEIASRMAGFPLGKADLLRRAIGKKKKEILDEQQSLFIQGCLAKGYERKLATEIYQLILRFASYGFNKSHAAAYALLAYQTAYLKANYPVEFMAALLTGYYANSDKISYYIADCRRQGIEVLPPDINVSEMNFTVAGDHQIRFGLAAVKNVGFSAIESILAARQKRSFVSLRDFVNRVDLRLCNKKVVESLIKSGAFDSLGGKRAPYLASLNEVMAFGQSAHRERGNGQISMFSLMDRQEQDEMIQDRLPDLPDFTHQERLNLEKETLGLYISGHPFEQYRFLLDKMTSLTRCGELAEIGDNQPVTVGGIIKTARSLYTKQGRQMAFVYLEDLTGGVEIIIFSQLYQQQQHLLQEDSMLIISGKTDYKEDEAVKIVADSVTPLPREPKQLFLKISAGHALELLLDLKRLLQSRRGTVPVYLYFEKEKKVVILPDEYWVEDDPALYRRLEDMLGPGSAKVQEIIAGAAAPDERNQ